MSFILSAKNSDQPLQRKLTVLDSNSATWMLHYGFVKGTWISDSSYHWDPEYLTFIVDSKAQDSRFQEKISRIPDSPIWSDSDPKINTFSVKLNPVN